MNTSVIADSALATYLRRAKWSGSGPDVAQPMPGPGGVIVDKFGQRVIIRDEVRILAEYTYEFEGPRIVFTGEEFPDGDDR